MSGAATVLEAGYPIYEKSYIGEVNHTLLGLYFGYPSMFTVLSRVMGTKVFPTNRIENKQSRI